MSTLVAQTISNGTVSTSSANVIRGSAKAWVNFYGLGTVTVNNSYNISSVTRNGTGDYTINFTNAMANANYAVAFASTVGYDAAYGTYGIYGTAAGNNNSAPTTMTTSALRFIVGGKYSVGFATDAYTMTATIFN